MTFHILLTGDNVPSANSYTLPTLLGSKVPNKASSSSYSMAARAYTGSFSEDLAKTPGPGRYNAVHTYTYTKKAPAYSMLGRSYMPGGMLNSLNNTNCKLEKKSPCKSSHSLHVHDRMLLKFD